MAMSTSLSNPVIAQIAKYLRGRHQSIAVSDPDIYTASTGRKTPRHLQPVMLVRHVEGVGLSSQQYPRDYLTSLGLPEYFLRSNVVLHVFRPIVDSASGVVNPNEFQSDLLSGRDGDVRVDEDRYPNAKWKEIARIYCVIAHRLGDKEEEPERDLGSVLSDVLSSARMDEYLTCPGFNHRDYEHLGDLDVGKAAENEEQNQTEVEDKVPDDSQSSRSVRHSQQSEDEKELELYERVQDHLAEAINLKKAALKLAEKSSAKSSSLSFSSHAGSSSMSLHEAPSLSAECDTRPYRGRVADSRPRQNENKKKRVPVPRPTQAQASSRRMDDSWRRSTPL